MSVQSFIKTVWSNELMMAFESQAIIAQVTFPVPVEGNKYIINKFGDIAVSDYEGTVAYGDLNTTAVEVPFDTAKYFAFSIKDLDKAQVCADLRNPAIQTASYKMAKTVDEDLVQRILESSANAKQVTLTKANVYEEIVDMNHRLDRKDVPMADRVIVCGWDIVALLEKDLKGDFHKNVVAEGIEYRVNGVRLLVTNRVSDGTLIAMSRQAVAYGLQLDEIESMRLESQFADGIRGLMNYGITVVRPEAIEIVKPQ